MNDNQKQWAREARAALSIACGDLTQLLENPKPYSLSNVKFRINEALEAIKRIEVPISGTEKRDK